MIVNFLLALASGLLLGLAFPPVGLGWLSVVALIPFLFGHVVRKRGLMVALGGGFLFGASFGGVTFAWLTGEGRWSDWFGNAGSLAGLGMTWSWFLWRFIELPAAGLAKLEVKPRLKPLLAGGENQRVAWGISLGNLRVATVVAASWTFLEWVRGVLMPSWNGLGLPLTTNVALLQCVQTSGVLGLTFIAVFCNVVILTTIRRLILEPGRMSWASRFDFTATLAIVFLIAFAGFTSLREKPQGDRHSIACVRAEDDSVEGQLAASEPVLGADLLVWPRTFFVSDDYSRLKRGGIGDNIGLVAGVASASGRPIAGSVVVLPGAIKNIVIPRLRYPLFRPYFAQANPRSDSFLYREAVWLPLLNWEAGSLSLLRGAVQNRAQIFLVIFDPAFRSSIGAAQYQQNLRAWSVALGRPLVFCSSYLGSQLLNARGLAVAQSTGANMNAAVKGDLIFPPSVSTTFYFRTGDWLPIVCGLLCIIYGFMERLRRSYVPVSRVAS